MDIIRILAWKYTFPLKNCPVISGVFFLIPTENEDI